MSSLFTASLPELYERFLVGPLFTPFAQTLLDRVGVREGDRLLDLACGTGIVARLAHPVIGGSGRAVGVDASPGMIAIAKSVAPELEWRQGDAARLPVDSGQRFDVICCHQGLQFFADRTAAIHELHRVIAPGGRLAVGVWRGTDEIPLMRDLQRVAERHLGPVDDRRHCFGDPDALRDLVEQGGFTDVRIETVSHVIRMPDATVFPQLNTLALVGMSAAGRAMTDVERSEAVAIIAEESVAATREYVEGGELVFELISNVAVARA